MSHIGVSRGFVGLILACFFLPFITLSCGGEKISLSGVQVIRGADIDESTPGKEVSSDAVATTAYALAFAGFFATLISRRFLIFALLSGLGALTMLIYKWRLDDALANGSASEGVVTGVVAVQYRAGYWLAFLLFIASAAWNSYLYWQKRQVNPPESQSTVTHTNTN